MIMPPIAPECKREKVQSKERGCLWFPVAACVRPWFSVQRSFMLGSSNQLSRPESPAFRAELSRL
jgi:hypothetical protein